MGSSSGLAGLKCLQWLFRGIQFCCAVIVLGIYAYYLASMLSHGMDVATGIKAVVGIAAAAVLYTALGLLLVCCCAGHPFPSFIALVLDIAFAAAFIYIAVANRAGANSCTAGTVNTVYGPGTPGAVPGGGSSSFGGVGDLTGGTKLPTFQLACQLEMACLIVACVAILFFLLSIPLEIKLNRSRYRASRPIRDADGEYINKSDYLGQPPQRRHGKRGALLGAFQRRGMFGPAEPANPDALPTHQQPTDMQTRQVETATWGDVSSLHDSDRLYFNEGEDRDEHGPPIRFGPRTAPRPAAETYQEGDIADAEYNLYREDDHGNDHSETGRRKMYNESRAARMERFTNA